jgi:DNA-binding transcriptional LysR family regulator
LFNRNEYRPTLTEQGKTFYRWAQQCLKTFRELEVIGKELGTQAIEPNLNIVLDPLVRLDVVQQVFNLPDTMPKVTEFSFRAETLGAGMQMLLDGTADFAVAPKSHDEENIESIPFEKIKMIPVVSRKLYKNEKIDHMWLKTHRQVVVPTKDAKGKPADTKMLLEGPKCFVADHTMKREFILNGFGWGRLATHEVQNELRKGTLVEIVHDAAPSFVLKLHVMRCKLRPLGPVARVIWNNFLANADQMPETVKATKKKAGRKS